MEVKEREEESEREREELEEKEEKWWMRREDRSIEVKGERGREREGRGSEEEGLKDKKENRQEDNVGTESGEKEKIEKMRTVQKKTG